MIFPQELTQLGRMLRYSQLVVGADPAWEWVRLRACAWLGVVRRVVHSGSVRVADRALFIVGDAVADAVGSLVLNVGQDLERVGLFRR